MNAAVFFGPSRISMRQVALTSHKQNTKIPLLRVRACAVCGYDVRVFRNGHDKVTPPIVLGHEICAETVDDLRLPNDNLIHAGTRVAISPLIPCLNCTYCLRGMFNLCKTLREIGSSVNGGFAEYVQIPDTTLRIGGIVPVPNTMRDEEASLIEPLSCCINGLSRLDMRNIDKDHTVCIIGDGPIGLIHLRLFGLIGGRTIVVGRIDSRMKAAKSMGADAVLPVNDNPELTTRVVSDLTNGIGANTIIVAASNPSALTLATKIASKNAQISLFAGMPKDASFALDANLLHYNQISVIGNFSATPDSMRQAIKLVSDNRINLTEVISHYYSLSDIEDALAATESFRGLRIVINRF